MSRGHTIVSEAQAVVLLGDGKVCCEVRMLNDHNAFNSALSNLCTPYTGGDCEMPSGWDFLLATTFFDFIMKVLASDP